MWLLIVPASAGRTMLIRKSLIAVGWLLTTTTLTLNTCPTVTSSRLA
ncbi:hypothetical protein [Pseudofulvimonas gallinarii]|nr:hypothetical protein [Pseudofulvimonas gallinarii]